MAERTAALDAATRDLLRASLREVFTTGADVDAALDELGWNEVLAGDPAAATTLLFGEQGRALGHSRALDATVLAAVPDVAADAVAYPLRAPAGTPLELDALLTGPPGGRLLLPAADRLLVLDASSVEPASVAGFDPDSGWMRVRSTLPVLAEVGDAAARDAAVAAGHRALAAEIVGTGWAVLEIATEHVSTRVAFGHPLAVFQSVRFRLAESWTWLTAAEALLAAAWESGTPAAAGAAKAWAGHAQRLVSGHATQVCGGMGVTRELPVHRYVRRGAVLDGLLGSADELATATGNALLDGAPALPAVPAEAL